MQREKRPLSMAWKSGTMVGEQGDNFPWRVRQGLQGSPDTVMRCRVKCLATRNSTSDSGPQDYNGAGDLKAAEKSQHNTCGDVRMNNPTMLSVI